MKGNYKLSHQVAACALLVSLFLQSCGGFSNQLTLDNISGSIKQIAINPLVGQECAAEGGYLVTFYEQDSELQADVRTDDTQKEPNYRNLPVKIGKNTDVAILPALSRQIQQSRIRIERSQTGQPSRVVICKRGLNGGMMEGDTEIKSPVKKLTEIIELRRYFKKGYLEITSQNYGKLMECCQKYESSFMSYEGGAFINGWEQTKELDNLIELLHRFSNITKLKVCCNIADKAALTETLAGAIQFYEELTELDLSGCQLGDEMVKNIMESICSKKLKFVNVVDNNISSELIFQLQEEFSEVTFISQTGDSGSGMPGSFRNVSSYSSRMSNSPSVSSRGSSKSGGSFSREGYEKEKEKEKEKESPVYIPSEGVTAFGRLHFNKFLPVIPKEAIEYGEKLGEGGMGAVYKATYQGETVAVKKLLHFSRLEIAALQKEAMIMLNLRHKNLISFLGYCPEEYALMMEYAPGGSLWGLLKSSEELSWQKRYEIALDVCEGMYYLHDCGIVHSDLKSENILLDSERRAKVTDFGISALKMESTVSGASNYGDRLGWSYRWIAPEIFHTQKNSKEGDVYSYGMLLWQLGARKEPFEDSFPEIQFNILVKFAQYVAAGNSEVITTDTPPGIKKVIQSCWLPEPPLKKATDTRQRPTMKQVRHLLERGLEKEEKEKEREKTSSSKEEELLNQVEKLKKELEEEKQRERGKEKELEEEKQRGKEKELEAIIEEWPQGKEILTQLKSTSDTLNLTNNYGSLNINQLSILFEHPRFKQITLTLGGVDSEGASKLALALPNSLIHTLDLGHNKIGDEGTSKLALALPNSQMHTLDLGYNNIGVEGASKLAQALPATQIHTLYLNYNNIGDEGASKLALALPNSLIHTLNLSDNEIYDEGASKLALALPNSHIHTLDLRANHIGAEGASKLALALPNSFIYTLNLWNNHIGVEGASKLALALPNTQIHTLDLSFNHIGDEGATKLALALTNSLIHTLDLSDNEIGAEGASKLALALPNSHIHTLDLRFNKIGDEGATKLALALPNSKMHTLTLSYNIGAEGATKLALALPNSKMHTLDLRNNHIGDEGATKLALALPNSKMHTLDLRNNHIGDEGATKLALALTNSLIHTLDLSDNKIGDEGASKLALALPNSHIHALNLSTNKIYDEGASKLALALPNSHIHILDLNDNKIGVETLSLLKSNFPHIKFYF